MKAKILLVENNNAEAELFTMASVKAGVPPPVHVCQSYQEAIQYLAGEGPFEDRMAYPYPHLLLSDLNLDGNTAFDLLRWFKEHPNSLKIPVVIFSASENPEDVEKAYDLGASSFARKPTTFTELVRFVEITHDFWTKSAMPSSNYTA